jgi:selenocysteine lyase/cysteine desulfurase
MAFYNLPLYRSWFPFLSTGKIWMNHAAISPLSSRVSAAIQKDMEERSIGEIDTFSSSLKVVEETRKYIGQLINASADRIAFVGNTSEGINVLATGLHWEKGDRIILNDSEFPTNVVPFLNLKRLGVEIDFVHSGQGEITVEDLEQLITPRTKLLSISFVQFASGFKAELDRIGKLCKEHDILLCVDAIQGLGVAPLDVQQCRIDFLACGGAKWLMGMMGSGFIFAAPHVQDRIQQSHAGWTSNKNFFSELFHYRLDLDETARRYENGTLNFTGIIALHASISTLLEVGIENIQTHVFELTDALVEGIDEAEYDLVTPRERAKRAGIVTFRCPSAEKLFDSLQEQKIIVSLREGMIRISPHFYNSREEVATIRYALLCERKKQPA